MSSLHAWASFPEAVSESLATLPQTLSHDPQWQAFVKTDGIYEPVTIGVQSSAAADAVLVTVQSSGKTLASRGPASKADFVLLAQPEQWAQFFSPCPVAPYTSFVGMQVGARTSTKSFSIELLTLLTMTGHEHRPGRCRRTRQPTQICPIRPSHNAAPGTDP